ncbi:lytic transglycosylase domain-containing protein [Parachitinimonas caeni]|uniref:Transglycosylase SLT domain-containing protein n=1 Tax=Parachitinimonas caeni TaxID=3031301 RepID=A0ABT7DUP3_9NEIS|nr:transglycosylase SLT domain-containing protein [Parachitinimonas caeni]MDK2123704.1 transglycosylase SLT domain-containing protein [Parachitinimonas caeni]
MKKSDKSAPLKKEHPDSLVEVPIDRTPGRLAGRSRGGGDAEPEVKEKVVDLIKESAARNKLTTRETAIAIAIARAESGFNPDAANPRSSAGGVGQFLNDTGKAYGVLDGKNRFNAEKNIEAMTLHLLENKRYAMGKTEDYLYKYHHDGYKGERGGLDISHQKVMPYVDQIEKALKSGASSKQILAEISAREKHLSAHGPEPMEYQKVVRVRGQDLYPEQDGKAAAKVAKIGQTAATVNPSEPVAEKLEKASAGVTKPAKEKVSKTESAVENGLDSFKQELGKFSEMMKGLDKKFSKELADATNSISKVAGAIKEVGTQVEKIVGLVSDKDHAPSKPNPKPKQDHDHKHEHDHSHAKPAKAAKQSAQAIVDIPEIKFVAATELTVKDAHKGKLDGQAFGGGKTEQGMIDLARAVQGTLGDKLERFTGFNDAYHAKHATSSKHAQGLAMDFTLKHAKDNKVVSAQIQQIGRDFGIELFVNNEYIKDSKHKTAPHIHVGFRSSKDAQKFAEIAAMPADEREALLTANRAKQEQALQAKQAKAHDAPLTGAAHIERETPKPPTKPEPKADAKPEPKPDAQPAPRPGGM